MGIHAVVQEDRAPSHAHPAQQLVYSREKVQRLLWCPNSSDLNMIEPAWFYLKRATTKSGAPKSKTEATKLWKAAWGDMPLERIRAWIERIPYHIKQINKCEGGNEYEEGRSKDRRITHVRQVWQDVEADGRISSWQEGSVIEIIEVIGSD